MKKTHKKLKIAAAKRGCSIKDLIDFITDRQLKEEEEEYERTRKD